MPVLGPLRDDRRVTIALYEAMKGFLRKKKTTIREKEEREKERKKERKKKKETNRKGREKKNYTARVERKRRRG